jgi:predicted dehydrogenase
LAHQPGYPPVGRRRRRRAHRRRRDRAGRSAGIGGARRQDALARARVERGAGAGDRARRDVDICDEDRAEWTAEIDFVAAVRGEAEVTLTDFATGVAYMAFLEAVERSNAEGRRVAIEP